MLELSGQSWAVAGALPMPKVEAESYLSISSVRLCDGLMFFDAFSLNLSAAKIFVVSPCEFRKVFLEQQL